MVKKMSMIDNQFREIMVSDSAAEHGQDQHRDRTIKNVDQAVSNQAILKHDGSGLERIGATLESQKQLVDDVFESNMAKKSKQSSAYPNMVGFESHIDKEGYAK